MFIANRNIFPSTFQFLSKCLHSPCSLIMHWFLSHFFLLLIAELWGRVSFLGSSTGKELACQCRRHGFDPWVGKISWRKERQPSPVFLPGDSHGWRSLAGYCPWGGRRVGQDLMAEEQHRGRPAQKHLRHRMTTGHTATTHVLYARWWEKHHTAQHRTGASPLRPSLPTGSGSSIKSGFPEAMALQHPQDVFSTQGHTCVFLT